MQRRDDFFLQSSGSTGDESVSGVGTALAVIDQDQGSAQAVDAGGSSLPVIQAVDDPDVGFNHHIDFPYETTKPQFQPPRTSTLPRYMIGKMEFFKVGEGRKALYVATRDLWPDTSKKVKEVSIINGRAYFTIPAAEKTAFSQGLAIPKESEWKYIFSQIYPGGPFDPEWGWNLDSNLQAQLELDLGGGAMGNFNDFVGEFGYRGTYPCAHWKPFPQSLWWFFNSATNLDVIEILVGNKHRGPGPGSTGKGHTYRCIASKERLERYDPIAL